MEACCLSRQAAVDAASKSQLEGKTRANGRNMVRERGGAYRNRTPKDFCTRTDELGKRAELLYALSRGVTLSPVLPMKRMGKAVSALMSSVGGRVAVEKRPSSSVSSLHRHTGTSHPC